MSELQRHQLQTVGDSQEACGAASWPPCTSGGPPTVAKRNCRWRPLKKGMLPWCSVAQTERGQLPRGEAHSVRGTKTTNTELQSIPRLACQGIDVEEKCFPGPYTRPKGRLHVYARNAEPQDALEVLEGHRDVLLHVQDLILSVSYYCFMHKTISIDQVCQAGDLSTSCSSSILANHALMR